MIENVQIEELYKQMAQSIIDGEQEIAVELAKKSIELNMHPLDTITKGFVVGVNYIGDQFGKGEAFLPELVMAGEAMKAAVAVLEPELLKLGEAREIMGRVVLATVEGDIHEIGKTLVGTMLAASGFEVVDLGVDQPAEKIIGKALEIDAQIIGMSALLTTTMVRQREVISSSQSNWSGKSNKNIRWSSAPHNFRGVYRDHQLTKALWLRGGLDTCSHTRPPM